MGRWSRQIGEKFLLSLKPNHGSRWLDLGCGTGALTSQILNYWSPESVLGIEPSNAFIASAENRINDSRVRFHQGTGDQLPLKDGTVDYAVSGFVLNFIDDCPKVLNELARAVVPGGTIGSYVWDYAGHVQFMRHFWNVAIELNPADREKDEGIRFPVCRPDPLRQLFEEAGLNDVKVEAIDIPTPFNNYTEYWTPFLSGVGPAPGYCVSLDDTTRVDILPSINEEDSH